MQNLSQKVSLAKIVIATSLLSLLFLIILHFASPEFGPSWRMVSEYALGKHQWGLTLFFLFWGISSCCLAILLWNLVSTKLSKAGVIFLFVSGIGTTLAAVFDVEHSLHGLTALLGIPTLIIAALIISYHLKSKEFWNAYKKVLLISAHSTWLSLVFMVISMIVMIVGFQNAGIGFSENSAPPEFVPAGVIAIGGYANRILILSFIVWLIVVAKTYLKVSKT
jgi:hypothetical membrane protein